MNASTGRYKLPDRNVLAGGIAGFVTWGLTLLLARLGVEIPAELVGLLVTAAAGTFAYMVPPTARDFLARLDGVVRRAGAADPATSRGEVEAAAAAIARAVKLADCGNGTEQRGAAGS